MIRDFTGGNRGRRGEGQALGRVRNEEEGQKLGGRKVNGGEAVLLEQRVEVGQVGEGFT